MDAYRHSYFLFFLPLAIMLAAGFFVAPNTVFAATSDDIRLTMGKKEEVVSSQEALAWFVLEKKLYFERNYRSEIENPRLCPFEYAFCDFALSNTRRFSLRATSDSTLQKEVVEKYLNTINTKISTQPVDAKFTVVDNRVSVFSLGEDGITLDIPRSIEAINEAFSKNPSGNPQSITLPLTITQPTVQSSDAQKLGIVQLIGEGRTNFAGSPKNRIHNFKRAMERFNGYLLAPQKEFSFVETLGPVDGEHGYLPELVIKNNKTEPEFGGGICQVSSTVFRAAIYSGLKITARRNHAYPVQYYKPYGMDATIYIPKPDLTFVNNTPGHILMQGAVEGNELIFRFYGTPDGRKTEVDGPHILEHHSDGSMKTVFTQKVTDAEGKAFINDEFKSSYKSPALFPHPGQEPIFTSKPQDWSEKQWSDYKQAKHI